MFGSRDYDDYDDEGGGRKRWKLIGAGAVIVALVLLGIVLFRKGGDNPLPKSLGATSSAPDSLNATTTVDTSNVGTSTVDSTSGSALPTLVSAAPTTADSTDATAATRGTSTTAVQTGSASTSSAPATTATPAPPTTQTGVHPTLPDGTPQPVLAVFDVNKVTLSGFVPSQEASDRLAALALANARTPDTTTVVNFLQIDPTVPISVGVRVVELTSARFPEGSAEVLGFHGLELERVATVMKLLPNVTALVIGHADQIGSDAANFKLSEARAAAVVSYLVGAGVQANRLSSRAVGEADLLTLNSDAAALALNRRTEFVLYGLLIP